MMIRVVMTMMMTNVMHFVPIPFSYVELSSVTTKFMQEYILIVRGRPRALFISFRTYSPWQVWLKVCILTKKINPNIPIYEKILFSRV
jgi:hypothetical protein